VCHPSVDITVIGAICAGASSFLVTITAIYFILRIRASQRERLNANLRRGAPEIDEVLVS